MHQLLQSPRLRRRLLLGVLLLPCACGLFALGWALLGVPSGGAVRFTRGALLWLSLALLLLTALAAWAGWQLGRQRRASRMQISVAAAGLEPDDYPLMESLFPQSQEVRLTPLPGGYSGAAVFQAQSWSVEAALQRASIVKVGSPAKLQPEVDNYERYVREYVGNTALLLGTAQRGNRMALRWAYAAYSGERVQTLADYAASGAALAPIMRQLFAPGGTLGLLLGTPRRDPQRALYQEYSWSPRDWERIVQATAGLLEGGPLCPHLPQVDETGTALPNPLYMVQRWFNPEGGSGERTTLGFDVPVATTHGDLNSRNILLDERGTLFVIDFAHTGPGHLLRDFARLESELTLVVNQPTDAAAMQQRVQQAALLLRNWQNQPCITLRELLQPRPSRSPWDEGIIALRSAAHDLAGPTLNGPATPYVLALLHTTLDTLRYSQCNEYSRRAALLIAARLCQQLV
ncbi:MAG: phosphotransferase [Chloroflexaceae bacterium]|jgi:hypothetical protein|nr:phosphotransferase [Chloroflexaceae bacterium]